MENELERQMRLIVNQRKVEEETKKEAFKHTSKARLLRILKRKFETTFIGAVNQVEEIFGFLWGKNVPRDTPLTEEQKKYLTLWNALRNRILNIGNNQLRAMEKELQTHDVTWNRYRITTVKGNNNG
jgi:hypothetical protein